MFQRNPVLRSSRYPEPKISQIPLFVVITNANWLMSVSVHVNTLNQCLCITAIAPPNFLVQLRHFPNCCLKAMFMLHCGLIQPLRTALLAKESQKCVCLFVGLQRQCRKNHEPMAFCPSITILCQGNQFWAAYHKYFIDMWFSCLHNIMYSYL